MTFKFFVQPKRAVIGIVLGLSLMIAACQPSTPTTPPTQPPFTPILGATNTPLPPTNTSSFSTLIGGVRTATPRPPTNTQRPATNTQRPPTNTQRPAQATATTASGVITGQLPQGFVAQKGFWQVYFTAPTGSRESSTYFGGIDEMLAANIAAARQTIDMAAYELNSPAITRALLDAHNRGIRVRIVTDRHDGLEDDASTLPQLVEAGIAVVPDTRSALMHNKFVIIDSSVVWMGSWNYTINDTYRNNNNALVLRSRLAVANYQAEFNEMFIDGQFGPRSPQNTPNQVFNQDGTPIEVYFAPEDEVIPAIMREINGAQRSIRFLAFSFTIDEMAEAMLNRHAAGVDITGIFETVGSQTQFSELTPLFCGGVDARQDGNTFILHHKVFIIDETTVLTGSFNFSANATNSNDENLLIIRDRDLAAQYLAEFDRRWAESRVPTALSCP